MTPPTTIHFASIDLGERGRSTYSGIEQLADSIEDNGLIQPIVLVPLERCTTCQTTAKVSTADSYGVFDCPTCNEPREVETSFGLDAGGRRYHALTLLLSDDRWDGILHHAATSLPGSPGFVLKGQDEATPLKRLMTELAENLDRAGLDWRDEVKLIVRAWKLARADAYSKGESILQRDFGSMLGVNAADMSAAVAIHDDLIMNPQDYVDVTSIRGAYSALLKSNARALTRVQAEKSLQSNPVSAHLGPRPKDMQPQEKQEWAESQVDDTPVTKPAPHLILSNSFRCVDSFKFMETMPDASIDHIYTDPDYAISLDRLSANTGGAFTSGVAQASVEDSLRDLRTLITEAARLIKPHGFFVFWYDVEHHETLQAAATDAGFAVQRWPLIWHKTDYRSNAAPSHNFAKNVEYAMVCRKHGAVLASVQTSCVYTSTAMGTAKEFAHPFAKPIALHTWILSAIAYKGQVVFDPFMGSATIPVAAINFGLRPVATELNVDNFSNGLMNIQRAYKKLLGQDVTFS